MMRIRFIIKLIVIVALNASATAWAANSKVGTSGAQFLKIGAGARPTAMGDAFVGLADDVNAVYFNPAGLGFIDRPELTAMHTEWVEDMNYDFGAFAYPTDLGAFAVSAATLKVDDIQRRGSDETKNGTFESMDAAYALSFARNVGPLTSIGVTARYFDQKIDSVSAGTWSGDIGILRKLGRLPVSFGLAARHFGQDIKFQNESDPQPFTIDGGFGAHLFGEKLNLGINVKKPNDNDTQFGAGGEYVHHIGPNFRASLRAGYNGSRTDPADANGLTFGGGIGIKQFNIDAAWVPLGDLGNSLRTSITFRF